MPITPQDIDNALKVLGEPKAQTPYRIGNALDSLISQGANGQENPAKPPLAHPGETFSETTAKKDKVIVYCPDCSQPMRKAGTVKIGRGASRKKVPNFCCENCGRRTVHPLTAKRVKEVT